jgi:3D (Asp-Asp-Asp) domain-containing protein
MKRQLILSAVIALAIFSPGNAYTQDLGLRTKDLVIQDNTIGQSSLSPKSSVLSPRENFVFTVTAYCPCKICCGPHAQGLTASGKPVSYNAGRFVAADTSILPMGTRVSIPGYNAGQPVEVIDTGSAIKGHKLDVYFPTHAQARAWGRQVLDVTVTRP